MKYKSILGYGMKTLGGLVFGATVGTASYFLLDSVVSKDELINSGNILKLVNDGLLTSTVISVASYLIGDRIHNSEIEESKRSNLEIIASKIPKQERKTIDRFADLKGYQEMDAKLKEILK